MQPMPSPVDLPAAADPRPALGWTSLAIATASLLLAATNAVAIHGWAVELAPSPRTAALVRVAEGWMAATDRIGLGAPRATVHGWWKRAQAARF